MASGSNRWRPYIVAGAGALATAFAGMALTDLGPWYQALNEPPWKPPDWAFGPIWTTIFFLAAMSAGLAWRTGRSAAARQLVAALFVVNALLNVIWSLLFFKLHRPDWSLVEVPALWLSILVLVALTFFRSRLASLFLVPYLVWVGIAWALNASVAALNGPFA